MEVSKSLQVREIVYNVCVAVSINRISQVLFQTSAKDNNNKYFIIQLLERDEGNCYWVWFHWGRVGYKVSFIDHFSYLSDCTVVYLVT